MARWVTRSMTRSVMRSVSRLQGDGWLPFPHPQPPRVDDRLRAPGFKFITLRGIQPAQLVQHCHGCGKQRGLVGVHELDGQCLVPAFAAHDLHAVRALFVTQSPQPAVGQAVAAGA